MRAPCEICGAPVHGRGLCKKHYFRLTRHGDPLAGGTEHGANRAAFDELTLIETDECVIWPRALKDGYGRMDVNGRSVRVHRMVCELRHGPPPAGKQDAAHSCGNRACLNYRHLRWASRAENEADKLAHGRSNRGRGASGLTAESVQEIRRRADGGEPHQSIAADYGVSRSNVTMIALRKSWAWVAEACLVARHGLMAGEA